MPPKGSKRKKRETETLETGLFDLLANPDRLGSVHEASPVDFAHSAEAADEPAEPAVSSPCGTDAGAGDGARADAASRTPDGSVGDDGAAKPPAAAAATATAASLRASDEAAKGEGAEAARRRAAYVKLLRFKAAGQQLTRPFAFDDDAAAMENEALLQEELVRERVHEQRTKDGVRFARRMLLAFTSFTEFMNKRYDPFGIDVEGWSDAVMENITDYDRPFERLIEKYQGRAEMTPEMELLVTLGGSMFMFHLSKAMAARMAAPQAAAAAAATAAAPAARERRPRRARVAAAVAVSDASSVDEAA